MSAIRVEGLSKAYGDCVSNRDVSLTVERGTVHAVVGENGAGKSTLLNIVYGNTHGDSGRLFIKDEEVPLHRHSPGGSIARGVGMVHQHFMLVPDLSVVENIVLGREPRRGPFVDLARATEEIAGAAARLKLDVDPRRKVGELSVGQQQRVEIVKALWRGADILLLDEPTAVLTPPEVKELLRALEELAAEGKTIVLVTHKLEEVVAVAERTTVMRGGRVVKEFPRGTSTTEMAGAIVGTLPAPPPARSGERGDVVLAVRDLHVGSAVHGVSLQVRAGEILGIAGVVGNGQTELVLAIAGLLPIARGTIELAGRDLGRASPAARLEAGLGHVAEDRHLRGMILDFDLAENLLLGRQHEQPRFLDRKRLESGARARLVELDVRPPDPTAVARSLSGGNQQKVVMARELGRPHLRALLAAEPTRGVDIGASAAIHARILAAASAGAAVLLVSSELTELRALADRLVVFYRGRVAAELGPDAPDDELGALMIGARA